MDAGFGAVLVFGQWILIGIVVLGMAYAVLFATAALGLTSFTMFERFRKKREEPEDDGIDGLF